METMDVEWGEAPAFALRGRQVEWLATIKADLKTRSRLLVVAPGGVGKSSVFGQLALDMWRDYGIKTLVLENRDRLTEQTADRLREETGLDVDVEKGSQMASPHTPIVVGCVQSISKVNRLTGFAPGHFGLLIVDECHLCLSSSWQRVINYFYHGPESLADGWVKPEEGTFKPRCMVVGFTASPDLGRTRNLGEVFQGPKPSVNYSYLEAIEEGWLVGIEEVNIPVRIDTRKFRRRQTEEGAAFSIEDQTAALVPIIKELAQQIVEHAAEMKGICFVPSIEVARLMTDALVSMGIDAVFVSGECIDKTPKTDAFHAKKKGWLINCALYNYGVDFPDVDCIAIFAAMISKVKYIQSIYRGTRLLPGLIREGMDARARRAAIATSKKPRLKVLSPFFISDRIHICEIYDMFGCPPPSKKVKKATDFTEPSKIRDYIGALEKAAEKTANRVARTIDPVSFALSIGDKALAVYQPETTQDSAPPTEEEKKLLFGFDIDTSEVKTSGQAQLMIARCRERERLGLAKPRQLSFLKSLTKLDEKTGQRVPMFKEEALYTMKASQAGAIAGRMQAKWRGRETHA